MRPPRYPGAADVRHRMTGIELAISLYGTRGFPPGLWRVLDQMAVRAAATASRHADTDLLTRAANVRSILKRLHRRQLQLVTR